MFFVWLGIFLVSVAVVAVALQFEIFRPGAVSVRAGVMRARGGGTLADKRAYTAPFVHVEATRSTLTFTCTAWRVPRPEPFVVDAGGWDRLVAGRTLGAKKINVIREGRVAIFFYPMHWKRTVSALDELGWPIEHADQPPSWFPVSGCLSGRTGS